MILLLDVNALPLYFFYVKSTVCLHFFPRLKAQEKKVDHLERAKRKEEIPLIKAAMVKDEEEDRIIWKNKEEERIKNSITEREESVKTRDRLIRMKEDKNAFMEKLLKERKEEFDTVIIFFYTGCLIWIRIFCKELLWLASFLVPGIFPHP